MKTFQRCLQMVHQRPPEPPLRLIHSAGLRHFLLGHGCLEHWMSCLDLRENVHINDGHVGQQVNRPATRVPIGLGLVALGVAGLAAWIAWVCLSKLPLVAVVCLMLVGAGALLLEQATLDDDLIFGFTGADIVLAVIMRYKRTWSHFFMLLSMPNLQQREVKLVIRSYLSSSSAKRPEAIDNGVNEKAALDLDGDIQAPVQQFSSAFDAASQWLRRPCLPICMADQLRLRALYLQAINGDATGVPEQSGIFGEGLTAELTAWKALQGTPKALAQQRLAPALAEVSKSFAEQHPTLVTPCDLNSGLSVLCQIAEWRLPRNLERQIAVVQRRMLYATVAGTVLAAVASLRSMVQARLRGQRFRTATALSLWATLGGSASSLYLLALVRGLPAWLHAAVLRRLPNCLPAGDAVRDILVAKTGCSAIRLQRCLLNAVLPKVANTLFLQ